MVEDTELFFSPRGLQGDGMQLAISRTDYLQTRTSSRHSKLGSEVELRSLG